MKTEQLTAAVFTDLLDPAVTLLDVCRRHAIPIEDLPAILAGDQFQIASRALNQAMELRAQALAPERAERALATLERIIEQEPTTTSHAECIRRAASTLLRATKPEPRASARADATTPENPTPTPARTPADPAAGRHRAHHDDPAPKPGPADRPHNPLPDRPTPPDPDHKEHARPRADHAAAPNAPA
ncbi:MAG: hypothetical protein LAT64_04330 [Phycisphaerales bacterium]|nr:hypothetical protein [Planctomycetota bacterium]MCH8507980.1 hypothetical protein [Phycisphaerales bacterium]